MEQRQWNDMEVQESKDLYCFQVSKFSLDYFDTVNKLIETKMEESITTKLLMNARKAIRQYRILVRRDEGALCQCSAMVN